MIDSSAEYFSKSKLKAIKQKWSEPDEEKGFTWDFDGVPDSPDHWMGYNHEMREGLASLDCKSFDELVPVLENKLGRKPNVVDLMGGAYFLYNPEKANTLTGIRIHDKDQDFLEAYRESNHRLLSLLEKMTGSPNRKIIEADILSNRGWNKIAQEGLPKADLLVCRPVGPLDSHISMKSRWDNPETYSGLYSSLFKRMLTLVNRQSGVIFTEIPDIFSDEEVKNFFSEVDKKELTQTNIYTVPDEDYHWGGKKRRYAVIQFGKKE